MKLTGGLDATVSTSSNASAVNKTMLVVRSLSKQSRLSDIASDTGLPASTVHRILSELVDLGWALQTDDRKYIPGARLLGLSRVVMEEGEYSRIALPVLRPLAEQTGYTVHFALLQQYEIVYVLKLDGSGAYRMKSRVGNSVHLHTTAIGKAILASMSSSQIEAIIARTGLPSVTERSISTEGELHARLAIIRQRGWSEDDGENDQNVRCVAAVVRGASGRGIGGVSLSGLSFDLSSSRMTELSPLVIEAADRLSALHGYITTRSRK
ncbi:MAG: hypothetical protein B5766_00765 [Candidatus Lumbricidophila eiseniae]|uniref:IclR family transcriptional regulator n=1 Tax=Candidatus Lumbricidiphila eiseniae TaxID=1969409 RepID=A0A2A6FUX9_9MICO|nr:MAG: hypothetical protein B5766_00765 [Candidatus Lumbricidophila eiseniae]